ncbi:MAG: LCP family protein [Actinomycetota bacterium]|nr:LCP family protein [Actinomycetota bacterium]
MAEDPRGDAELPDDGLRVVRRPRRNRSGKGRRIAGIAALVVLALVGVAAAGAGWGLWSFASIEKVDLDLATTETTEPQNFLIVGSDSRAEIDEDDHDAGGMLGKDAPGGQRADSLMIARVDPDSDRVDLLSVPRDLWVPISGTGKEQRINSAYSESAQAVVDTVQDVLGIPIHHFVEVDFRGFEGLVNALGGVPMYFDHPVRDKNSGLFVNDKGCTVLDGRQGLAFARARHLEWKDGEGWHSDPTGDLGRMTRQQILTRAALSKAQTMGIGDVGRLKGLVDAGIGSVRLDATLGTRDIVSLGSRISDLDPDRMQTHALPVVGHRTDGGAAVVLLDGPAAEPVLQIFRGLTDAAPVTTTTAAPPSADQITVDVFNGSGIEGEARRISFVLTSQGDFVEGAVEPADEPLDSTVIEYPLGSEAMAQLVASWITPAATLEENEDLAPATVRVTLGADFEAVSEPSEQPETTTTAVPVTDGTGTDETEMTTTTLPEAPGWTPGQAPQGVVCA